MKHIILGTLLLGASLSVSAQDNHSYGASDNQFKSLAEEVAKLQKHNDMFNVYLNWSGAFNAEQDANKDWGTRCSNKQLRLEIKGNLTDKLYYRLRHRLNKSQAGRGNDNFAKATDIMMVGYKFSDKFKLEAGKMCQYWGGFEFDENPMYIYEFSDMVGNMDNYHMGVAASIKPIPTQELILMVTNTDNDKFADYYAPNAQSVEGTGKSVRDLEPTKNGLTYIANWNGSFLGDKLRTRWAWGLLTQAKHKYSRMMSLGQQLNLPKVQWYFDYMNEYAGLDRLRIASSEIQAADPALLPENHFLSDVHYDSFITKVNWQFAPQWNFMAKGMYETASVSKVEKYKNYRKHFSWITSVEYYPVKSQDFRLYLAYIGHKVNYSELSGLKNYNTNRIELGFMYRIKAY